MYVRHFGLQQPPFSIAPDPRYLYLSERHREALAHLMYGVRNSDGGFVVLTGEIGTGKTTVCRCLLEQIPRRCNVAYIFNPKLTVEELLRTICEEFRIPVPRHGASGGVKEYVDALNEFLLRTHAVGQNNVLIIDEAQNLSAEVLEQLRLLTNLETNERKLLQIVLIGQPELKEMLARPQLAQLAQRVVARYHLGPLAEAEVERYIRHRLAVAGLTRGFPFDASALRRIQHHARGIPRRINLVADRALLGAYATGRSIVDAAIVDQAAREVFESAAPRPRRTRWPKLAVVGMAGAAAVGGIVLLAGSLGARGGAAAPPPAPIVDALAPPAAPVALSTQPPVAPQPVEAPAAVNLALAFDGLIGNERAAWRELSSLWNMPATEADPCQFAHRHELQCYRTPSATLALIRQLDRPGIVTLRDGNGRTVYALLTALSRDEATLRAGGRTMTVSLHSLADYWRGEFATLWRTPPGYSPTAAANSGPLAEWVATQLAALRGESQRVPAVALRARIYSFQLAQGLPADGVVGPVTLMALNRAAGVNEPRLGP
ncbi:MAG: AAA family ATPase [Sutterellaceae bacterium]|nr:AAA family ATPase [Burkholderiaceae bacterium]MCX7901712.1 AAA family ATPase [Burkholderiaceae bacterium]MDW8429961.1 AAA family ATPase [Sutterellaceae bacterium]